MGCAAFGGRHFQAPRQRSLDPYRGVGRYREAHIRVQKEPVVGPAGAGTDYIYPEGSPDRPQSRRSGDPSGQIRWNIYKSRIRGSDNVFPPRHRSVDLARRAHCLRRR